MRAPVVVRKEKLGNKNDKISCHARKKESGVAIHVVAYRGRLVLTQNGHLRAPEARSGLH